MALDVAALLAPLSEDAPAGANLEYDAEFIELGTAAQRKPDQQFGDVKVAGEEPDWEDVQRRALGVLERTRDLRAAMILAQAIVRNEGYTGFRDLLALVSGYLADLWGPLHPQLDPDDDNDPTMRVNLLSTLCNVGAVLKPLREAPVARSRMFGVASLQMVAEIETAAAAPAGDGDENRPKGPSRADLDAICMDCPWEELAEIHDAIAECQRLARQIESTMTDQVGASHAIDMSPLSAVLKEAMAVSEPYYQRRQAEAAAAAPPEVAAEGEAPVAEAVPGAAPAAAAAPVRVVQAGVHSRADALRAIDEIIKYFQDNEPTSPVPILLGRARRWMSMDFMSLLGDIAPDAAREVERLKGGSTE